MKKVLSLLLFSLMLLSIICISVACGDDKNEETEPLESQIESDEETEAQTEALTEKQSEQESESESESDSETEFHLETIDYENLPDERPIIGDRVILPENTYYCDMQYNDLYASFGVPANLSSIVDAWVSYKEGFDRGLTFCMALDDLEVFTEFEYNSGDGARWQCGDKGFEVYMADPADCFIYNGKPESDQFGTRVASNIGDLFEGCICSATCSEGPYVWVGNLWDKAKYQKIENGFYTFVIYNKDHTEAVAFTEWVVPSFYQHAYDYKFNPVSETKETEN